MRGFFILVIVFFLSCSSAFSQVDLTEAEEVELAFYALLCLERSEQGLDKNLKFWKSERAKLHPEHTAKAEDILLSYSQQLDSIDSDLLSQRCFEYHAGTTGAPIAHNPSRDLIDLDSKVRQEINDSFSVLLNMGVSSQHTEQILNYFIYLSNNIVNRDEVGARMSLFLGNLEPYLINIQAQQASYTSSPVVEKSSKEVKRKIKDRAKKIALLKEVPERRLLSCYYNTYYQLSGIIHDPDYRRVLSDSEDVYDRVGKLIMRSLAQEVIIITRRKVGGELYDLDVDVSLAVEKAQNFETLNREDTLAMLAFTQSGCSNKQVRVLREMFTGSDGLGWSNYADFKATTVTP